MNFFRKFFLIFSCYNKGMNSYSVMGWFYVYITKKWMCGFQVIFKQRNFNCILFFTCWTSITGIQRFFCRKIYLIISTKPFCVIFSISLSVYIPTLNCDSNSPYSGSFLNLCEFSRNTIVDLWYDKNMSSLVEVSRNTHQ